MPLGQWKERFLNYINKVDFDHSLGVIDPTEFYSPFITLSELFSVMDYKKKPYWMYISPTATVISAILSVSVFFISVTHYLQIKNIYLVSESGIYFLIALYKLLLIIAIISSKEHYHTLLQALREDFNYICTRGHKYRERFFKNHRLTFKATILMSIFTGCMGGGISACACIVAVATILYGNGSHRPLPFPLWIFDYDLSSTPTYEILFIASLLFIFFDTYLYIFNMQSQILWIRQIASKADVIVWNLQDLLTNVHPTNNRKQEVHAEALIKYKMREIIKMHHSMIDLTESFAGVFKMCLLYEQLSASAGICMTSFCSVKKLEQGEFQPMLFLLFFAVVGVVFIPSYLCTHLLEKTQSVGDACWDIPFWNARPTIRPYLVLLMQRSTRKLPTVAAGFEDISLQTYAKMLSRSYQCFNMLRQADFDLS